MSYSGIPGIKGQVDHSEDESLEDLRERVVRVPAPSPRRVVVLLSGGLDSATLLAWVVNSPDHEVALAAHFHYGSRQEGQESVAVELLASYYGVEYIRQEVAHIPSITLTKAWTPIPDPSLLDEVPTTYVPHRNLILLAYGAAHAYHLGCGAVGIGVHEQDSPYPDCTRGFITSAVETLRAGCDREVDILVPFLTWSKEAIVALGLELEVPYDLTYSCYAGDISCGECDACCKRLAAFKANNAVDPLQYREA